MAEPAKFVENVGSWLQDGGDLEVLTFNAGQCVEIVVAQAQRLVNVCRKRAVRDGQVLALEHRDILSVCGEVG